MTTVIGHTCNWPQVKLGDYIDLQTGFPFKSANYTEDETGIRLLRGDNVAQGTLRWDDAKRWPISRRAGLADFELREGDVILSMDRPWIEAGLKFARVKASDIPALLVQRVARLRGRGDLCTEYLLYVVGSLDFTEYVKFITTGTAVPHISAGTIAAYKFLLPPLPIQRKIACILSTWDHAIDLTVQLITAKQQYKCGLMQQLLMGKRRFREFANRAWTQKRLGDLFVERRETSRSDLPLLSITSKDGIIQRDAVERRDTSNEDKSKYLRICKGDIGYNTMRMWQGVSAVSSMEGIVSPAYTICIPSVCTDAYVRKTINLPLLTHKFAC